MKRLFFVLFVQLAALSLACAQKLVPQFTLEAYDLTAQSQSRVDLNGRKCALVKVLFVGNIVGVDGNIVGETVRHTNELWVYMPQHSMHLKVVTKDYLPLMVTFPDYGIEGLESGKTYVLTLAKPESGAAVSQSATPASSSVTVSPEAEAYLDGYFSGVSHSASSSNSSSLAAMSGNTITIPVNDNVSIEMVRVEAGSFMMGATSEMENPFDWEKPAHRVTLTNSYYMGKYEVTQALWRAVMGNNPSNFKGDNLPVERVSWDYCQTFISKLNSLTGRRFRLPTEAEWEFAARGGNRKRGCQYSGSNNLGDVAWYGGNSGNKTHAVGTKLANELGLYDMAGNVWEWCQDWYGSYSSDAVTNPVWPQSGAGRVYRGGCWYSSDGICHSSCRGRISPDKCSSNLGLRLCLPE